MDPRNVLQGGKTPRWAEAVQQAANTLTIKVGGTLFKEMQKQHPDRSSALFQTGNMKTVIISDSFENISSPGFGRNLW